MNNVLLWYAAQADHIYDMDGTQGEWTNIMED